MHWTSAQPGCLDAERELLLINQTPGEVIFLSAADTDLTSVSLAWRERFGNRLRVQAQTDDSQYKRVYKNGKQKHSIGNRA